MVICQHDAKYYVGELKIFVLTSLIILIENFSKMELEAKLDEDFLFYLNFTDTFLRRITDEETKFRATVWLHKLIGDPCEGIDKKRGRNLYLANLLIQMQNNKLEAPFTENPFEIDIMKAVDIFGPVPETIEPPEWLNDTECEPKPDEDTNLKQGRTYVATRTLPHGQGAFAYVGVSLTDKEPMWLGAGESSFDPGMKERFDEMVRQTEMEKILARRKDPREREKVLTFYDVLMQNIADELDGKETPENETIEGLLIQLIHDLNDKGQYEPYEQLEEVERRVELLLILFDRVKARRDKIAKREEVLDDIEQKVMPQSFFDVSDAQPDDKYKFPAAMWEQAIDKIPTKHHMEKLQKAYPLPLIQKFLSCLSDYKENIAIRMQRRHENIVGQMRKEMRKEGDKKRKEAEEAEAACENALEILDIVKKQNQKKIEAEKANNAKTTEGLSEHSKIYESMKAAVFDTQRLVEEEAIRGKFLANQINAVEEQTEAFSQVNDDVIKKTEEANMKTLRNIKQLNLAINRYEQMIAEMRNCVDNEKKNASQLLFF